MAPHRLRPHPEPGVNSETRLIYPSQTRSRHHGLKASPTLCSDYPHPRKGKTPLDLPSLCEQADRYELPKPPGNSKLVLFHTGSVTGQNGSWSPIYDATFFLKNNGDGTDSVMAGFAKIQTDVDDNEYPLILPFDGTVKKALPNEYVFRCDTMNCFATAIQCARRGNIETAGTFQNHGKWTTLR